jgi:hypothetical protein
VVDWTRRGNSLSRRDFFRIVREAARRSAAPTALAEWSVRELVQNHFALHRQIPQRSHTSPHCSCRESGVRSRFSPPYSF